MYPAQPAHIATTPDGFLLVYSETHIDVFDAAERLAKLPDEDEPDQLEVYSVDLKDNSDASVDLKGLNDDLWTLVLEQDVAAAVDPLGEHLVGEAE